jgi:quercetin dioxygenase-like cupin family protein
MRAVDAAAVAPSTVSGHRAGRIGFRRLLSGDPASPSNFEASLTTAGADYYTPRHRHTFDQVRLALRGTFNWAHRQDLQPGRLLYVPEGTWYGPQHGSDTSLVFLLQYGGAGGAGFLAYDQLDAGHRALAERGAFERGVYHPADGSGALDGYEAIHRHVTGREVAYPAARYALPLVVDPEAFAWAPTDEPGVAVRRLGSFGERGHGFAVVRVAAGAVHRPPPTQAVRVLFLVRGALRVGDGVYGEHSAFALDPGETGAVLEAVEETELFVTTLHREAP